MKRLVSLGVVGALMSCAVAAQEQATGFYVGAGYGVVSVPKVDGIKFSDPNNGFIQLGYQFTKNFSIEGQYSKSTKDASARYTEEGVDFSEAWWQSIVEMNPGATISDAQSWFPFAVADMTMKFDVNVETTAIYGVYRSGGDLYVKAKAGYLSEKSTLTAVAESIDMYIAVANGDPIEFSANSSDEEFDDLAAETKQKASETSSDFSAGLGVGYKFTSHVFSELEYTMLNDDLDFYSLSINWAF
ncbi:outer membrane beta-barrel protein [Cellvibrio sp. NN19]|uniref:outer membrane beta-barrel protein n=1 Tax=Cellvibrio chitinivorans TaxID=3102792 RepID=UPI002B41359C|nr:outer membrane beta-barrel protein [Cellvibrio sp. NN19]